SGLERSPPSCLSVSASRTLVRRASSRRAAAREARSRAARRGTHPRGERMQPVDETHDLGIVSGFGDYGPAVGVADEEHRTVLESDRSADPSQRRPRTKSAASGPRWTWKPADSSFGM